MLTGLLGRRDSCASQQDRLGQLARAVLQLEEGGGAGGGATAQPGMDDRSYLFLQQPLADQVKVTVRVTLAELLTGLTAHSALLGVVEELLDPAPAPPDPALLALARESLTAALQLDNRPGLKFLLQKVAQVRDRALPAFPGSI